MSTFRGGSGAKPPPDEATLALLARVAGRVVDMRMSVPAILFLETSKPLAFVGSQVIAFFEPLVKTLFRWDDMERLRVAFEDRDNIELLIVKIEEGEALRRAGGRKEHSSPCCRRKRSAPSWRPTAEAPPPRPSSSRRRTASTA